MTNTSTRNCNVAPNQTVILDRAIQNLKAVLFELHDHRYCNAVPMAANLGAIDQNILQTLQTSCQEALDDAKSHESQPLLDMVVVKLNSINRREFCLNVEESLSHAEASNP